MSRTRLIQEAAVRHLEVLRLGPTRREHPSMRNLVGEPWQALVAAFQTYAETYNEQFGQARILVESWPDLLAVQAGREVLTLELNRHTGQVRGSR